MFRLISVVFSIFAAEDIYMREQRKLTEIPNKYRKLKNVLL